MIAIITPLLPESLDKQLFMAFLIDRHNSDSKVLCLHDRALSFKYRLPLGEIRFETSSRLNVDTSSDDAGEGEADEIDGEDGIVIS